MAEDHSYNGWKNYETWAVNLWITNDQGSYDMARGVVDFAAGADDDVDWFEIVDGLVEE